MRPIARRATLAGLVAGAALPTASAPASGQTARPTRSFELTFLKSHDADPGALVRFITANWFEMDRVAVEQGIMTEYRLLQSAGTGEPWNVLVIVGYPTPEGYAGIAPAFDAIRAAHTIVPIDGKRLKDLGSIVMSRKLLPSA